MISDFEDLFVFFDTGPESVAAEGTNSTIHIPSPDSAHAVSSADVPKNRVGRLPV